MTNNVEHLFTFLFDIYMFFNGVSVHLLPT